MKRVVCSLLLMSVLAVVPMRAQAPEPASDMQGLVKAFVGKWAITEKFEPDEWTRQGGTGHGEEVWRAGPGGFTLTEEIQDEGVAGKSFGLALTWWDQSKGLQGIWCASENPKGCDVKAANKLRWDGKQFVFENEFSRSGKTMVWHEVFSDITPTSFVQTADIGEVGQPLKRWLTIHAKRIREEEATPRVADEAQLHLVIDERRRSNLEGDTESMARSLADEYVQTDVSGYVQDKSTWLREYFMPLAELIKAGKFRWVLFERKDEQIRILGDCAVITGVLEAKGTGARPVQHSWVADPDATFSGALRFTHVYVKRDGKWLLAALHNQMLPSR